MAIQTEKIRIHFDLVPASYQTYKALHPRRDPIKNATFLKKDTKGRERRYIVGTSSGSLYRDAHGERMTERCVKGFVSQASEKAILFVHPHTENLLEDQIGILDDSESFIDNQGEWKTIFRLFDDFDSEDNPEFNPTYAKKAATFWQMVRGEEPYKKPTRICQLSIQGLLDEKDVIKTEEGRDLDWIEIDAVAGITRGAYPQDDFTTVEKVLKQFDSVRLGKKETQVSKGELIQEIQEKEKTKDFYDQTWDQESALRSKVEEILESNDSPEYKKSRLTSIYDEYRDLSLGLFERYNFSFPDAETNNEAESAEGDIMAQEPDSSEDTTDEEKKKKDLADSDPAGGSSDQGDTGSGDQKQAVLDQAMNALNILGQAIQALAGNSGDTNSAQTSKRKDDTTEDGNTSDEDKKKNKDAVSEMPESNVESDINKAASHLRKMGIPESEVQRLVSEIRKKANPLIGVNSELTELKKHVRMQSEVMKGVLDAISEIANGKLVQKTAPVNGTKEKTIGTPAQLGGDTAMLIAALGPILKQAGIELKIPGGSTTEKGQEIQGSPYMEFQKSLNELYKVK